MKRQLSIIVSALFVIGFCVINHAISADNAATSAKSFSSRGKVWIPDESKLIQLNGVTGIYEVSLGQMFRAAFTSKVGIPVYTEGIKARTRLKKAPTVIYTRYMPQEIGIALLTIDEKENRRTIWVEVSSGSNKRTIEPPENEIKFDEEMMDNDDVYKLTFKKPLSSGEYALMASVDKDKILVYDFAVEKVEALDQGRIPVSTKEATAGKSASLGEPLPISAQATQKVEKSETPPRQAPAPEISVRAPQKPAISFTLAAQYKGSKLLIDGKKNAVYDRIISMVKKNEGMSVKKGVKEKGTIDISIARPETKPLTMNVVVSQIKADVKVDLLLVVNDSSTYTTDSAIMDFRKIYDCCEP